MTKLEAVREFKKLPEEQQKLIKEVVYTTIDLCNEYLQDEIQYPIIFPEANAYKAAVYEIMQHVYNKEVFDWTSRKWTTYGNNELY